MQLTLHATRRTPHGVSSLAQALSALSVKTRRAPSRHCREARVYGHATTAMHELSRLPPPRHTAVQQQNQYLPRMISAKLCNGENSTTVPSCIYIVVVYSSTILQYEACADIKGSPPLCSPVLRRLYLLHMVERTGFERSEGAEGGRPIAPPRLILMIDPVGKSAGGNQRRFRLSSHHVRGSTILIVTVLAGSGSKWAQKGEEKTYRDEKQQCSELVVAMMRQPYFSCSLLPLFSRDSFLWLSVVYGGVFIEHK